jgi:protocatechuate 3,4-dioxygenase beta subunit
MPKVSDVPHLGKAIKDAIERGAPDVDLNDLPNLTDMSADKLTENVLAINAGCQNPRQKFVLEALVRHMHAFVKEVGLTPEEWMTGLEFLTKTGQMCSDIRQEFILLSDVFGVSALVDTLNHPKPEGATEATVLGPFWVEDARVVENGEAIAGEDKGEPMLVKGRILDTEGKPVPNCLIETWETDEDGYYDTQYSANGYVQDCRGRLYSDKDGNYAFRCVMPVPYPIPNDGPVGKLLRSMNRHVFRPAHLHMMFECEGYEKLVTALYFKGDIFLSSDAVFGVKSSLVEDPKKVTDAAEARKAGFKKDEFFLCERDFVLITTEQAAQELEKAKAKAKAEVKA